MNRITKTLTCFCAITLLTISCVEHYPFDQTKGEAYSFSVDGNAKFQAVIRWGVNGVEYNDRINANGYGSGFELKEGDKFFIQVDTASPVKLIITSNETNFKREMMLTPGTLYEIDPLKYVL